MPCPLPLQVDALRSPKRARLDAAGAADLAGAPGAGAGLAGADAAGEQTALQGILANELQLRDRNSMLAVPNRNFSKVLALLGNVQKEAQKAAAARPQKVRCGAGAVRVWCRQGWQIDCGCRYLHGGRGHGGGWEGEFPLGGSWVVGAAAVWRRRLVVGLGRHRHEQR